MNDTKRNIAISAGVSLVIALLVIYAYQFLGPVPVEVERPTPPIVGAVPGPDFGSEYVCFAGSCTWHKSGDFADATMTPLSIRNPWGVTTTALVRFMNIRNGTTSINLAVGTSSAQSGYATSSPYSDGYLTYLNYFHLLITTSTEAFVNGSTIPGNTSTSTNMLQIVMGPNDYLLMVATGTNGGGNQTAENGLIDGANTFSGQYSLEFRR